MAETAAIMETLKRQLRRHRKTYRDVAQALELSEASVKRLFARGDLTLARLDRICQLIGMEPSDLLQAMAQDKRRTVQLTEEQEREIASDLVLLLVAVSVVNGYSFEDILAQYAITPAQCVQKLARLDRLKLIELLPGNRIKLLLAPNFRWVPGGPIQRFFLERVADDFFRSRFDQDTERLIVLNGLLSRAGNARWQEKLEALASDFSELCRGEATLPLDQRSGTTTVLALRQWQYSLFQKLGR